MKCPVCGCKMMQKQICPYCKITDKQVLQASNKKVKEFRKAGNKDLICFSTVVPQDVSRIKLILLTILLGWLGINHYYVKRVVRGSYSLISLIGSLTILIVKLTVFPYTQTGQFVISMFYELFFTMMAINVLLWIFDIFNVIFKAFKIPVVLPEKGELKDD